MKVKKGQWYTYCCHLDLTQADQDFELDEDDMGIDVWESELQALKEIQEWWKNSKSPENVKECQIRIDKITDDNSL